MKKNVKRLLSLFLAATMCISLSVTALATEETQAANESTTDESTTNEGTISEGAVTGTTDGGTENSSTTYEEDTTDTTTTENDSVKGEVTTTTEDDNVIVKKSDKPYLALGQDLSAEQQAAVLELMGIDPANLANYDVVYVTNDMEHQYLDSYLPASTIGSKALSSVLIMEGKKGSGIQISTKNISYCTVGMYKNALATAGLEDAEIIVAGPFPISGTAALIGALQAYSQMTGKEVSEDGLDAAMNEIVITGELSDATNGDKAKAEEIMAYLKQEVVKNNLDDEESIQEAIKDAEKKFDIKLTDAQVTELTNLMMKISDLDLDWNTLKKQASDLYDRLADLGFTDSGFLDGIKGFFQSIIDFFKNLF